MELACEQISQVDVLILDELGEAMRRGLLPLANLADLVTEMRPIKHYFDEGLLARQGIEY